MDLSMNISQRQEMRLTQQMIQSMEILQMSTAELKEYIEKAAQENPVIELNEDWQSSGMNREQTKQEDHDEYLRRRQDWLESTDRQNLGFYENDRDERDPLQNMRDIRDEGESLKEYLESQMMMDHFDPVRRRTLSYILDSLDSRGYFADSAAAAADFLHVSEAQFLEGLNYVQSLEPAGTGARDLKECLLLQLKRRPYDTALAQEIVQDYLPDMAKNHVQILARKLKKTPEQIEAAFCEIRTLDPKPGCIFNDRDTLKYVQPDAVVTETEDGLSVIVRGGSEPGFTISPSYRKMVDEVKDRQTRKYLNDKIREADQLESAVRMRSSTLEKILTVLVDMQQEFFRQGPGHKVPMSLDDIAQKVDLHPSTVSRTLRSKYLQCGWGVFPLSYFLTASVTESAGGAVTPEQLKERITKIVEQEDKKHPLSDEAIRKKLDEEGISIARRTVNKYRKELNIPDRSGRKLVG